METVLIAGTDTVVGINLALHLADRYHTVGVSLNGPVCVQELPGGFCPVPEEADVRDWLDAFRPDRVVYCPPETQSAWFSATGAKPDEKIVKRASLWAEASREYGALFTLVSSDAVFTGPWIFHDEASTCFCASRPARCVRRIEKLCAQRCPGALVVRTNVFGWSHPQGDMERLVNQLESHSAGPFDFIRHATPILATDFADLLHAAWQTELQGLYHLSGAERINPNQFVQRVADEFGLPGPLPVNGNRVLERPTGYGCGETSLHTTALRKATGLPMPDIAEGLQRLREQKHNGYWARLHAQSTPLEKVA